MEAENLNIGLAFLAGLVSFISPCVLPLVPAYIGYMGGRATNEAGKENRQKFGTFIHGIFFVLGFSFFFVGFGLLTAAASSFLDSIGIDIPLLLTRLGGVAIILFGLYIMKALDPVFTYGLRVTTEWKDSFLKPFIFSTFMTVILLAYFFWSFGAEFPNSALWAGLLFLGLLAFFRKEMNSAENLADFWHQAISRIQIALLTDTRRQANISTEKQGYTSSFGLGIVFSAGWTPCIGPVYGAVLALATDASSGDGSLTTAGVLLTAYSMGLGIPFLLTALAFNQSTGVMTSLKRNMQLIERFSGILLLIIGFLILSGGLTDLSARFASDGEFSEFSFRLEECTAGVVNGRIGISTYPSCVTDGIDKLDDLYITSVKSLNSTIPFSFEPLAGEVEVGLREGNRAPDFELETLSGETVSLADYRGQAVLLNFWATWCGPCRLEMPHFNEVYLSERARGFTILAVNLEESNEQVQDFVDELGLDFPILMDRSGEITLRQYRVTGQPTSYLLDGNGIIQVVRSGPLSTGDLFRALATFETESSQVAKAPYEFDDVRSDVEEGLEIGDRSPDFNLLNMDGESVSLSDYRGQAVLLNFWATWCGPCRREMPDLNTVYYSENSRGFVVLSVNLEESPEQINTFIDELGVDLDFPIVLDEDGLIHRQFRVRGQPTNYLIDGNGIIVDVEQGPLTANSLYEQLSQFEPSSETDPILRAE